MKKNSRALTSQEKQKIIEIVVICLEPLDVSVIIPEEYSVIHCKMTSRNREEEWDEYFYHIAAEVDKNKVEMHCSVDTNKNLFDFSWLIAWDIFRRLKYSPIEHPAAKSLWNKREELKAKYQNIHWDNE